MIRSNRTAIAVMGVCLSVVTGKSARAIDAVFLSEGNPFGSTTGGRIEVQGFSGRIDLPITIQGPAETSANYTDTVSGVTSNGSVLYTLLTPETGGLPSVITEADAHSGAYLGTIQLPGQFSGIAYTNGQLYGVQSLGGTGETQPFQIVGISSTGATQPIATQSTTAFGPTTWHLSGSVTGDSLFVTPSYNYGTTSGYVFTPTTPQSAPAIFALPEEPVDGAVIHAGGAAVTLIENSANETDYTYPSGAVIGPRAEDTNYGSSLEAGAVSDEFSYTYASNQPGVVSLGTTFNATPEPINGLYRLPQVVNETATVTLQNGVAPDGTTISNVVASKLLGQTSGLAPLPMTIQETDALAGPFSARQLAQASISINLANASRGIYTIGTNSNVTGDYTIGGVTQTERAISVQGSSQGFAYDPVSSNLVGNGDGSLQSYGWQSVIDGETINQFAFPSSLGFFEFAETNYPEALQQILQVPTSNGPMLLSFDYALEAFDPGDLSVTLNGVDLGNLVVSSSTPNLYQTVITDPALEGVSGAELSFNATDPAGSADGVSYIELGSISLTAVPVPEPAAIDALGGALILLLSRRRGGWGQRARSDIASPAAST